MKTYPGAVFSCRSGPQAEPTMTGHDVLCLHTMVGVLAPPMDTSDTETARVCRGPSHLRRRRAIGQGRGSRLDGTVWQWQDRKARGGRQPRRQAPGDLHRDRRQLPGICRRHRAVDAAAMRGDPQLFAWSRPLRRTPTARRRGHVTARASSRAHPRHAPGRGVGYHQQGCDPWRVGRSPRSPSRARSVPARDVSRRSPPSSRGPSRSPKETT